MSGILAGFCLSSIAVFLLKTLPCRPPFFCLELKSNRNSTGRMNVMRRGDSSEGAFALGVGSLALCE
jgi:hypothetical protein